MLYCKFIGPNLLEVEEVTMSFFKTYRSWWYINTEKWLESSRGTKNDTPDRPMSEAGIEWCKKYYIPKATGGNNEQG